MKDSTKKSNLTVVEAKFIWMMCSMNAILKELGSNLEFKIDDSELKSIPSQIPREKES